MHRRDVSKLILLAAGRIPAAATLGRSSDPVVVRAAKANSLQAALAQSGYVLVPDGTYRLTHPLQTLLQNTIIGESRQSTILSPSPFDGYVLEVGDGRHSPNAGLIQRLRFYGAAGNRGCLHLNTRCHMWHLDELAFSGGPCPAIVVDDCWDANLTNIDILGHITPGSNPASTASVIFHRGTNNIYCRGLRIEGALSGGIYVDAGPVYVVTGKIDDGGARPQTAPAVTVTPRGYLVLDDFYVGGVLGQFQIDVGGTLRLGKVFLDGGTDHVAAIQDRRTWQHLDAETVPGISGAATGPALGVLDLGQAQFKRYHPSLETDTPAAVLSRIHPIRQVENLTTLANGTLQGSGVRVATSLRPRHADTYKNSYLVHNATGTSTDGSAGARRRILGSLVSGELLLQGTQPVILDADWSIEYCETLATPISCRNVILDRDQQLFAVLSRRAVVSSTPSYVSSPRDPAYGTTLFEVGSAELPRGRDVRGLFLIDNATGETFYIQYGLDQFGRLGLIYDRRRALAAAHTFSIVAGYAAPNSG